MDQNAGEELGGKGVSLVRLAGDGLPVPPGFVLTTAAYHQYLASHGLREMIISLLDRNAPAAASELIGPLFHDHPLPSPIREVLLDGYAELGRPPVAVRSSATAEDLPGLSFAGQQDSYLNVRGDQAIEEAVRCCWASLFNARAIGYRRQHRVVDDDLGLAVVVQELIDADASGVMFTADPVSGERDVIQINAAWGLGEAVVSGQVSPDTFRFDHRARLLEHSTAEKLIMTVRSGTGTGSRPVPAEQRTRPSLTASQATRLAELGVEIDGRAVHASPGGPTGDVAGQGMDIEWCRRGDEFYVLQARPITTTLGTPPAAPADPWNDSLGVDCLWTNGNVGEAIPDVMTPATWCLVREFLADAMPTNAVPPYEGFGRIGGRIYLNLSMAASIARCAGITERFFRRLTGEVFGRIPAELPIPYLPLPAVRVLRLVLPVSASMLVHARREAKRLPAYLHDHPGRCEELRAQIAAVEDADRLVALWTEVIHPEFHTASRMLTAATRSDGSALVMIRRSLQRSLGPVEAERLLAGSGTGELASLGPLRGLEQLATGEIDAEEYRRRHGHRGPHEFEISTPRPAEDPRWLERMVREQRTARSEVSAMLDRQRQERATAWARLSARSPRRAGRIGRKIDRWTRLSEMRELARSEVVRFFWVLREFWVRAGELTGVGDEVFSYDWTELLRLLGGVRLEPAELADRQRAYQAYATLPPYPQLIKGRFDPFAWAADPDRRPDVYDADRPAAPGPAPVEATVTGFAGSAGVVEATVRVLSDADQSDQLRTGEILVTSSTNVGWTPLFPRCAAVITDVGAPLSHAAIVARELGIPAVVGCGTATSRLRTGDRVRVDGSRGTVTVLDH